MKIVKKILSWLLVLIVAMLVYQFGAALLAYSEQRPVSQQSAAALDTIEYRSNETGPDRVEIISDNDEALLQRIRAIDAAQQSIELASFTFHADESGSVVLGALMQAADRGVQVNLIIDSFNGQLYSFKDLAFTAAASHKNVQLSIYNPVNIFKPWKMMGRMHDKYLIVDDSLYILGGRNTYDGFLNQTDGYQTYDWDALVLAGQGEDSSIWQLKNYFDSVWQSEYVSLFRDEEAYAEKSGVSAARDELYAAADAYRATHPQLAEAYDYAANSMPTDKITLLSNHIETGSKEPQLFYALTNLMGSAQEEVRLHTPYILLNDQMYSAFAKLSRAVPVTVMTNSAGNNANVFAAGDYAANRERILGTGVHLLEFEGGVSYHGKCMVIDRDISVVGSFNMDMRSAYLDTELMLVIDSEEVNADMRDKMAFYETQCGTVTDDNTVEYPAGVTPQEGSLGNRMAKRLLHTLFGWARFLL